MRKDGRGPVRRHVRRANTKAKHKRKVAKHQQGIERFYGAGENGQGGRQRALDTKRRRDRLRDRNDE